MFKFTTGLYVWKNRIKKDGNSTLYLLIYIYGSGSSTRQYLPLNIDWPIGKIDFRSNTLLPRFKEDPDMNDYNMVVMSQRAKVNDIAKKYRLVDRLLALDNLKRELVIYDSTKSAVLYFRKNDMGNIANNLKH